jgi:hypothetical protein
MTETPIKEKRSPKSFLEKGNLLLLKPTMSHFSERIFSLTIDRA